MIPVALSVEGLYSYQERQTIDFSALTNAGLFGIFGAVGSGKSSILEAVSFALYGDTERMNSKEKRSYNMMNLKSDRMYIEFDFYNYENQLFRITREAKRNSKRFDDVKTGTTVFYEYKNGGWSPLDHTDAVQLTGLSYANFKRTIIIPQGQFKEFLELGAKERTDMMKDIFQLDRFDLLEKTTHLSAQNNQLKAQLEGQLKGYEAVSPEEIEVRKEQLNQLKQNYSDQQQQFEKVNEAYQHLKALKVDFESLVNKKAAFLRLEEQQKEILEKEERLILFELISKAFGQLLKDIETTGRSLNAKQEELNKIRDNQQQKEEQLKLTELQLEEIMPLFQQLSGRRTEENDWELALKIRQLSVDTELLNERLLKGQEAVRTAETEGMKLQKIVLETEEEIVELKTQKLEPQLLLSVGNWFNKRQQLNENFQHQQSKVKQKEKEIQAIEVEFKENDIVPETFETLFQREQEALKVQQTALEKQKTSLDVQQELAHYATTLKDGEPCPLCGALEHPEIAEKSVSEDLKLVNQCLFELEQKKKQWEERQKLFERLLDRKHRIKDDLKQESAAFKIIESQLEEHQKEFIWNEFDARKPEMFYEKQQQSLSVEQQIEEKSKLLAEKRLVLEGQRSNIEKYKKALEEITLAVTAKKSEQAANEKNLKVLQSADFQAKEKEEVETILTNLRTENQKIEEQHKVISENKVLFRQELAGLNSRSELLSGQLKEEIEKYAGLNLEFENSLKQHGITAKEEIDTILSSRLDPETERRTIQDFRIQFETLRNAVNELEKKFTAITYSEEHFNEETVKWQTEQEKLKENSVLVVREETELNRLEKAFDEKKTLLQEFSKLEKRAEQLSILYNLFKGAGFVQYISSIYLRQLCDMANVRFHRMTRNQLSLQLGADNNFEIIDYLNEGKSRSVKTLSGGQAFQVSLALALALAESVQANVKAEKNFFFIDEGFGTQDAASVDIVFETLLNLNKENKIVGIISHVEELKERIPKTLQIVNDPEKGSRILSEE